MIKYAVIPADVTQPIRFEEAKPSLELWQGIVGGYIEAVTVHPGGSVVFRIPNGMRFFVNEEGKFEDLPANTRATLLARFGKGLRDGDYIAGDVAVYGGVDGDGDCTSLKDGQEATLRELDAYYAAS